MEDRPNAAHPDVVQAYAELLFAEIKDTAALCYDQRDAEKCVRDLKSVIVLVDDAYHRTRLLNRDHAWTVDSSLVALFMSKEIPAKALRQAVQAWVLRNGVRFPAKERDTITFRITTGIGGEQELGVVEAVLPDMARALVRVAPEGKEAKINGDGVIYTVNAEDVIRSCPTSTKTFVEVKAVHPRIAAQV